MAIDRRQNPARILLEPGRVLEAGRTHGSSDIAGNRDGARRAHRRRECRMGAGGSAHHARGCRGAVEDRELQEHEPVDSRIRAAQALLGKPVVEVCQGRPVLPEGQGAGPGAARPRAGQGVRHVGRDHGEDMRRARSGRGTARRWGAPHARSAGRGRRGTTGWRQGRRMARRRETQR